MRNKISAHPAHRPAREVRDMFGRKVKVRAMAKVLSRGRVRFSKVVRTV